MPGFYLLIFLLNKIQLHILMQRLLEHFNLSSNLVGCILNFFINRTQGQG